MADFIDDNTANRDHDPETPDLTDYARSFKAVDQFNEAHPAALAVGQELVESVTYERQVDELVEQGLSRAEAIRNVLAIEASDSPLQQRAKEMLSFRLLHSDDMRGLGLRLGQSEASGLFWVVENGEALADQLHTIACGDQGEAFVEFRQGLEATLSFIYARSPSWVIDANLDTARKLYLVGHWHQPSVAEPEHLVHLEELLQHAGSIGVELEALGCGTHIISELVELSAYYDENALLEWAVIAEMDLIPRHAESDTPAWSWFEDADWQKVANMLSGLAHRKPQATQAAQLLASHVATTLQAAISEHERRSEQGKNTKATEANHAYALRLQTVLRRIMPVGSPGGQNE